MSQIASLTLPNMNPFLLIGGGLSFIAAFLHIACILGGANYLRFFGAGEGLAKMAEAGHYWPAIVTMLIAIILMIWGVYAWCAAAQPAGGQPLSLPYLKVIISLITGVYLLRGAVLVPILIFSSEPVGNFAIWSSAICFVYGLVHLIGLIQVWSKLT